MSNILENTSPGRTEEPEATALPAGGKGGNGRAGFPRVGMEGFKGGVRVFVEEPPDEAFVADAHINVGRYEVICPVSFGPGITERLIRVRKR